MASSDGDTKKADASGSGNKDKKLSAQEIVEGFRKLREEQRQVAAKITELEMDRSENK